MALEIPTGPKHLRQKTGSFFSPQIRAKGAGNWAGFHAQILASARGWESASSIGITIGKPIYGLEITTGNWAGNPARISTRWCQKAGLKTSPLSMAPESRSAPNHAAAGSTSCIRCAPKRPPQWRRRRVPFLRHPTPPSHLGGRLSSGKPSRTRSPAPPPTTTAQKAHTHVPRT